MHELEKEGYRIHYIPVNNYGVIDFARFEQTVNHQYRFSCYAISQLGNGCHSTG